MRVANLLAVPVLCAAGVASAAGNDFRLNATIPNAGGTPSGIFYETLNGGNTFTPKADVWKAFALELGSVIAPRLAAPAETLGHAGFGIGLLWSGSLVSTDQDFWKSTTAGQAGTPRSLLQTLQLEVRKGLPLSFEVGFNFVWLADSQMFAPGFEVRWAPIEGYRYLPDVAMRGSASHLVGSRDVNLTVVGLDVVLSKGFGVAGFVNIAPYVSMSALMVAATPRVLDPTPTDEGDVGKNFVLPSLSAGDNVNPKLTLGSRFIFSTLNVSVQGELVFLEAGVVTTIGSKLGVEF